MTLGKRNTPILRCVVVLCESEANARGDEAKWGMRRSGWRISPSNTLYLGALGTYLDTKFLGPDFSNEIGNITHYVHIPATTAKGEYTIQGAHFELTGVSTGPATSVYYANITVGDNTSSEYVRSALIPQTQ
ncbi:Necrosis-inducing secreted protein 1 [Fulvia fulva]|uniref:Necrosis-inducing secreted protein 1 n=1 Tax=Passalora fulva TaxID=5499 RepID=A0A9Q8PF17_PASFU|nr:Necrosis-inducing secreted protein 1 [Fulvia fulva]KAK4618191.1 Necrosis-inducing secreted protein 1 [Fulvia fulva]KAK4619168.1 Necrosis-inducing secreted protein 1 [Fulvia fulva]UJO21232.1 Necrosis-inducing secreted protein 1 [Fulvia fulva]WPV18705.1 Necrosis-inducing secreted protein 1 [Fulvia fulva]WPV32828.1 Necrosis-inducing secreted protein 1 [Fulvia fulva]